MEIKIRQKPQRSTGKTSLVLEYYYGYTRDDEGRIKHRRKFETLEYYLYTDPKNKLERDHNKVNLEMAEKVKAKRLLAEQNEQYGFAVKYKIRTNLVEYIKGLIEQRKESPGNWGNWDSALKHLVAYAGTNTTFEMVDKKFVEGFKTYLAKQAKTKSNTALSTNSQSSYFLKLKAALNQAVEDASRKFRDSVMIGGIVTLLIVFIGLIGYTNDEVNRRRKEMAIRKINGATVKDILHIFLKDIITMALPAILLGCGIAFYISQKWQEQFSEKIQLSWYLFVGGGVLVLTVILAVSGYNVFRTTHDNPVNNLKSE